MKRASPRSHRHAGAPQLRMTAAPSWWSRLLVGSAALCGLILASPLRAQTPQPAQAPQPSGGQIDPLAKPSPQIISPITQPNISPGVLQLMELEGRFGQAVAAGGGKAFAAWFADDAVTLNNGRPAVLGRANIAAQAQWDPKTYQLTWSPEGAQMGPSNDMGFTWGHYEGHSKDASGQPVVISGRYITLWKKVADGSWKVAMDASANDPPAAGECCALPKP